jgi:hypothetical protein
MAQACSSILLQGTYATGMRIGWLRHAHTAAPCHTRSLSNRSKNVMCIQWAFVFLCTHSHTHPTSVIATAFIHCFFKISPRTSHARYTLATRPHVSRGACLWHYASACLRHTMRIRCACLGHPRMRVGGCRLRALVLTVPRHT